MTLRVTPITRPRAMAEKPRECKELGDERQQYHYPSPRKRSNWIRHVGVLVCGVTSDGPAGNAKPALERGRCDFEVNHKPVKSLDDLRTVTAAITAGKSEPTPVAGRFPARGELLPDRRQNRRCRR